VQWTPIALKLFNNAKPIQRHIHYTDVTLSTDGSVWNERSHPNRHTWQGKFSNADFPPFAPLGVWGHARIGPVPNIRDCWLVSSVSSS
jgi:hypothetical protein